MTKISNEEQSNNANVLLAEVKTAKGKCIAKWEKRLNKAIDQQKRWGNSYWNNYAEKITLYQEVIKDLKRV